ncbi:MAG: hypothetical protein MUO23_00645 [Anaerolineales bacterium]|nr:hypothetical protein [Anaerolineales bacterium]
MTDKRLPIILAALTLTAATLACQIDLGGPPPPPQPVTPASGPAASLDQVWRSAVEGASESGEVVFILDEAQLTGYLSSYLAKQQDPVFSDPQVSLRDGRLRIQGTVQQGVLKAGLLVTIVPEVNPEGGIAFRIESADLGPAPAPEAVKESISAVLTELLSGPLGSLATGVRVTSLVVDEGQIAIVGELH